MYKSILISVVDCGQPNVPRNVLTRLDPGTKPGAKVHFSCHQGYKLEGSTYATCNRDGHWQNIISQAPSCSRKHLCVFRHIIIKASCK